MAYQKTLGEAAAPSAPPPLGHAPVYIYIYILLFYSIPRAKSSPGRVGDIRM